MPATFETLEAARLLIDYATTSCDKRTVAMLLGLLETIAGDLQPDPKRPPANVAAAPEPLRRAF